MKTTALIFTGMACFTTCAQQEYSFTHYFEANSFYNPASTGSEGTQNIVGLFRKQWLGYKGTPVTGGLLYENKLSNYNMGIGGYVFTDKIGETLLTTATANYAYQLQLSEKLKLAFGIDAGADFITTNYGRLEYWDKGDQLITENVANTVLPKVGLGTHLYGDQFYVGLSCPRVLNFNSRDFHTINSTNVPMIVSHYYLTAGYKFKLNEDFNMETNTLVKYTRNVWPQADLNATCIYRNLIGLGLGYKTLGFATAYLNYTYDNTVVIGYAYDLSLNPMAEYSRWGTHELLIKYQIRPKSSVSRVN